MLDPLLFTDDNVKRIPAVFKIILTNTDIYLVSKWEKQHSQTLSCRLTNFSYFIYFISFNVSIFIHLLE